VTASRRSRRSLVLLVLTVLTGVMTVVTIISAEWIEEVFGVHPDGGSGALELGIVVGLALVTVLLAIATTLTWRTPLDSHRCID
jgi:energy-coupling factor transporter transmembrane protein EcfT